ncbi:MAG: ACT domain-containing protein [Terriglobia bacterium]
MAKTKVLTITVQNQPGAVAEITRALGSAKVNILALLGTAQGAAGTVHLVVEDAKRAKKVLDEAKLVYQETGAEQHELANKPGALAQHLEKLTCSRDQAPESPLFPVLTIGSTSPNSQRRITGS